MSPCEPLIPNNYIVDESRIDWFIQKKDLFMFERNKRAQLNILFTLFTTGLYYFDIIADLQLSLKYYKDEDIWWFIYTLVIVIISISFNTLVLFKYSYLQEYKFNWKKEQYWRIVKKSFCLLFQLEMLLW
jgi:hypothetical protein